MRTLSLLTLAAGAALVPAAALAQPAQRAGGVHVQGPNVRVQHPGMRHGPGVRPGRHFRPGPGFRPGHNFQRRLHRGFVVPRFWFGPQFHINNWQMYGFAAPGHDQRWVRYYDDAYLIDREGRIVDTREGLDWDEYGERWELEDGIPSYYGRNEYHPGERDYEWVEEHGDRRDERHVRRERHGGHGGRGYEESWDYSAYGHGGYGAPLPPGVAVYGGGYGYGYYAYPIVIETTTTAASSYIVEEVIEEVVETRRPRARRARCNCPPPRRRAPRPRPPAGERG